VATIVYSTKDPTWDNTSAGILFPRYIFAAGSLLTQLVCSLYVSFLLKLGILIDRHLSAINFHVEVQIATCEKCDWCLTFILGFPFI